MRKFKTGASRDIDTNKIDFEGHLSPEVLEVYGEYMHQHRSTKSGLRASDDWQKGIPKDVYAKSLIRHAFQFWKLHRGCKVIQDGQEIKIKDSLCGIMFNAMGYLLEEIKHK